MIMAKAHGRSVFKRVALVLSEVLCLLLCCIPSVQSVQKLSPDLFSVSFPTDQIGFACGRRGTIFHTADGGATWTLQRTGTRRTLSAIKFLDPQVGWAVGDGGTILHTEDGGKTWTQQKSPVDTFLMDVEFINKQKGWAVTEKTTILHTEDGGSSWQIQFKDEDFVLKSISFVDERTGWAVGEFGFVYHTENGGATWTKQAGEFRFSAETGEMEGGTYLFHVLALDPKTVWVVGIDGHVAITRDGGKSWQKVSKGVPKAQFFSIAADAKGTLFIAGTGTLLASFDGGDTFKEVKTNPPVTYGWLYNVNPRGKAGMAAVGKNGWIYLSDPKGETWRLVSK